MVGQSRGAGFRLTFDVLRIASGRRGRPVGVDRFGRFGVMRSCVLTA